MNEQAAPNIGEYIKVFTEVYHHRQQEFETRQHRSMTTQENGTLRALIRSELSPRFPELTAAIQEYWGTQRTLRKGKPNVGNIDPDNPSATYMLGRAIEHKLRGESIKASAQKKRAAKQTGSQRQTRPKRGDNREELKERSRQRYINLVKDFGYVPPDHVAARLLGLHAPQVVNFREEIADAYILEERRVENAPELANNFWVASPKIDPRVEQIRALVENMSDRDKQALVELLSIPPTKK